MADGVTAQQILGHLSPYDLNRVTFQMPDGLPVVAVYVDTDEKGGAVITLSDREDCDTSYVRIGAWNSDPTHQNR